MFPKKNDSEIAEEASDFFNRISCEYDPLSPNDVPVSYDEDLPVLTTTQVAERLKKTRSLIHRSTKTFTPVHLCGLL